MSTTDMTILRDHDQDYIPLALPEARGVFFKVLKADRAMKRAVVKIKFEPNAITPRHVHLCRAFGYTINGEWEYDNGTFKQGDIAYEPEGEDHTPSSGPGAELILLFDSDSDDYLENHLSDGTIITFGMDFFEAMEGKSLADAAQIDMNSLMKITPPSN